MLKVLTFDGQGKEQDALQLSVTVAQKKESPKTFANALRALFFSWRQGTACTKTRGEIAFSNQKPWRQKGTGRARAGTRRSPIWRKGGVTFGPQQRPRKLSFNAKQKKHVLNNLLFSKAEQNGILSFDFVLGEQKPSTKKAASFLKQANLSDKKVLLFLPFADDLYVASFRNIPNVNVVYFDEPNVFDLANADCWVMLKKDTKLFEDMVQRWN
ncbi:MAG: 50S ribosomal protein L4 [Epsilonproteobacteria bacterium]|nr:50S ribosomal protein L4 [Campylobacterota bacterium]